MTTPTPTPVPPPDHLAPIAQRVSNLVYWGDYRIEVFYNADGLTSPAGASEVAALLRRAHVKSATPQDSVAAEPKLYAGSKPSDVMAVFKAQLDSELPAHESGPAPSKPMSEPEKLAHEAACYRRIQEAHPQGQAQGRMDGYKIADEMRDAVWVKPGYTFTGKNYEETIGEIKRMVQMLDEYQRVEGHPQGSADSGLREALEKLMAASLGFDYATSANDKAAASVKLIEARNIARAALSTPAPSAAQQPAAVGAGRDELAQITKERDRYKADLESIARALKLENSTAGFPWNIADTVKSRLRLAESAPPPPTASLKYNELCAENATLSQQNEAFRQRGDDRLIALLQCDWATYLGFAIGQMRTTFPASDGRFNEAIAGVEEVLKMLHGLLADVSAPPPPSTAKGAVSDFSSNPHDHGMVPLGEVPGVPGMAKWGAPDLKAVEAAVLQSQQPKEDRK